MVEVFKLLHNIYDPDLPQLLTMATATTRGHNYNFFKTRAEKNIRQKFFSMRIVNMWNSLSYEVVNAPEVMS